MIYVDRNNVEIPNVLIEPDDGKNRGGKASGLKEIRKGRDSLEKWKQDGKDIKKWNFGYKIYKHEQVKKALTDLFHGKCAYCETRYAATQPMDVEHWRPKGQIELDNGENKKPAYYWLAAHWNNLLPSCIDCNRERKQTDAITGQELSMGKKGKFPIDQELDRADAEGGEAGETPLLLNPCETDPADYLQFQEEGVLAPKSLSGLKRRIAKASILVYGLNRSDLVLNRKEYMRLIDLRIEVIKSLARLLIENTDLKDSVQIVIEELILKEMQELAKARDSKKPYALMARQTIDKHMEDFRSLEIEEHL